MPVHNQMYNMKPISQLQGDTHVWEYKGPSDKERHATTRGYSYK